MFSCGWLPPAAPIVVGLIGASGALVVAYDAYVPLSGGTLSALTGTGLTRTAVFTPAAGASGSAAITVVAGAWLDAAGNHGGAGAAPAIAFDTLAPTLRITSDKAALLAGESATITFTFSEDPGASFSWDGASGDVVVAGGSLSAILGTGAVRTAVFTPAAGINGGTASITVAAGAYADAAGNAGTAGTAALAFDTLAPAAPSLQLVEDTGAAGDGLTGIGRVAVKGLEAGAHWQYSLDGGKSWVNGSGTGFEVQDNREYVALARQADAAGNAGPASAPLKFALDSVAPGVRVDIADAALTAGETTPVSFVFSEAVTGFGIEDISAPNGTLAGLSSSDGGITWRATFTPNQGVADDSNAISVNAAGVQDLAGNAGVGSASSGNYTVFTAGLGASVAISDSKLMAGETALVSITFSEAVTGFTLADMTAENGKLSQLASSDGGRSWTALFTPNANISDTTNLITLDNTGVTGAHGVRGVGTSTSANYEVSTIRPAGSVSLADHLLAPNGKTTVTIKFSEAVSGFDASDLKASIGTLSGLSTPDGGITWTATLTAGAGGQQAQPGWIALDTAGVANVASNAGMGTVAVQYVLVPANAAVGTVDGVQVVTQTIPAGTGNGAQQVIITVPEVAATRSEDASTPNGALADIPLAGAPATGTAPVLTAALPVGAGLQAQGNAAPLGGADALTDLIQRIQSKTEAGSSTQADMSAQGQAFLGSLGSGTTLQAMTITPSLLPGAALDRPIVIAGSAPATPVPGAPVVGLVIDGSGLPAGSTLQLDNVEFAAVVGDMRVIGGAGRNTVVGDGGSQVIYLGAEDDQLFGGAGDDFIGSAGGDDYLDGGTGKDLVAGGIGNDSVFGGAGDDIVLGGRSVAGEWTFYLSGTGVVTASHANAVFSASGSETVQGAQLDAAVPGLGFLRAGAAKLEAVALLYGALDRVPDLAGLSFWAQDRISIADVARGVLASTEFGGGPLGQTDDASFIHGMYEHILGRAPDESGLDYWLARLSGADGHPASSRADVLLAVALSGEHKAKVPAAGLQIGEASVARETSWFGNSGDDRLDGGLGNDLLVGGDGRDTAVYAGERAQYHLLVGADAQVRVLDTANGDVDTLSGIEQAAFKDGSIELDFLNTDPVQLQRVGLLYQAVLDHAAGAAAVQQWSSLGLGAVQLAQAFIASAEFKAKYEGMADAAFMANLYANSGLAASAAGGVQSWIDYLQHHSRAELVASWIAQQDVLDAQFGNHGLWLV